MKIVLPGGSGQIGTVLARAFVADGHEVVVLSRGAGKAPWKVVTWDAEHLGSWISEIDGCDVVINLAGKSVNCRYHAENRRRIKESRVNSTRILGEAIARASRPPKVWLQSSTATIYAHRYDAPNDEQAGILGRTDDNTPDTWRFSIDVAKSWEQAANDAHVPHTRKVLLRSAMVMSPDRDGVFDVLLGLVRWGLGGRNGNGRQYISWIHDVDFIRAIYQLIEHDISGPVNLSSPYPVPNEQFMRTLRKVAGARLGLPAMEWMIEIGAWWMGTESELILKSRRVVPTRLLESGFTFQYPTWEEAAADLFRRWKTERDRGSTSTRE